MAQKFYQKPAFIFFAVCLAASLVAVATYYFTRNNPFDTTVTPEEDVVRTVAAVSKLMVLPTDEKPTVATVSDVTKLSEQPFFKNAANGDKVLIFNQKKQAILWRPDNNLIIEVAPINITESSPSAENPTVNTASPTPAQEPIRFFLYNGARVSRLTQVYETELLGTVSGAEVAGRDNAENEYDDTVLIDLSGSNKTQAETLAKTLGITVSELPDGEIKPSEGDFLIIVGKDKAPVPTVQ